MASSGFKGTLATILVLTLPSFSFPLDSFDCGASKELKL